MGGRTAAPGSAARRSKSATILVADDDADTRRIFARVLRSAGHEVVEAGDGAEAMKKIDGRDVALVLLDFRMPGMGGVEVIQAVRREPSTATLPIILVTGESDLRERVRGLEAGANDYLTKPIHPDELLARVQSQLRVQSAWRHVVEGRLQHRAEIANSLARIRPEATPEATAEVICSELGKLRSITGVALLSFAGGTDRKSVV